MAMLTPAGPASPDRRAAFLIRAGQHLASSLDLEETLRHMGDLAVPELADWCAVHVPGDGDTLRLVALRYARPENEPLAREWQERFPARRSATHGIGAVIRDGTPSVAYDLTPEALPATAPPGSGELLARLGIRSAIIVPILTPRGAIGAISLAMAESGRRFTHEDLEMAQDLAARAAAAMENARLHREAREQARRAAFLAEASRRLASSLDPKATMREVMALAVPAIADWGVVYTKRPDGGLDRAAYLHSDPECQALLEEVDRRWPAGPRVASALARVTNHCETVLVDPIAAGLPAAASVDAEHEALMRKLGLGHSVLVPLVARGEALGVIALTQRPGGRAFAPEDVRLIEEIGVHAGAAFENARIHDRLARLQAVTSALTPPLGRREVARVLLQAAGDAVGATSGVLTLYDPETRTIDAFHNHAVPPEHMRPFERLALDADLPVALAVRTGEDIYIESPEQLRAGWSGARDAALVNGAWAVLALKESDAVLGAVWFGFAQRRVFDPSTRSFLRALADQGAQALVRARLAEAALVRQQLLESQNESTLDAIFFQDAKGRPAFYNQRLLEVFGVPRDVPQMARIEDRLARSMEAIADPGSFVEIAMRMEREAHASLRFDLALKDGRILDAYTAPVMSPSGKRLGRAWYYRDVTEARRLQRELLEARQQLTHSEKLAAMGSLVSGVAHEVRTPLAYAANHAHLLAGLTKKAEGPHADAMRESTQAILDAVDRINRLVQDLRRFTRIGGPAAASCAAEEASGAAARLFEATHPGRVALEVDLRGTARVAIERVQLQQILLNLLENAVDASSPAAPVRLSLRVEEGDAVFAVQDHGAGIPADVQARMWEPFFTTKPEGTGLGLSIVRRIVETHGGSITVQSAPGQGAIFTVRLPVVT